jgi:thioredoxin reductase
MAQFYDVIIIGSGPAGLTAALYLGRAGQKCVVLEKDFVGGYTAKIAHIENYPGYETINGMDLTQIMAKQAEKFGATIVYPVEVVVMELKGEVKRVRTREERCTKPCGDHRHWRCAQAGCAGSQNIWARACLTVLPATACFLKAK